MTAKVTVRQKFGELQREPAWREVAGGTRRLDSVQQNIEMEMVFGTFCAKRHGRQLC
jgi:hypothetical protein